VRQLNHRPRLLKQLYERRLVSVSTEISVHDGMFEGDREHYFSVGHSALRCITLAMLAAGKDHVESILDFGCGFGRVLRVLRLAFAGAELAACDLSPEAIEFCAAKFGAEPLHSSENPTDVVISRKFDLIWCGTLLTNVEGMQFRGFLELFDSLLVRGGILVFTTHGPFVAGRMRNGEFTYGLDRAGIPALIEGYDVEGFGYMNYPQDVLARLGVSKYGISVSRPSWVCRQIEDFTGLQLLTYTEKAWDNHQDSIACLKR
jgi:SAM-dependent methyltransferase